MNHADIEAGWDCARCKDRVKVIRHCPMPLDNPNLDDGCRSDEAARGTDQRGRGGCERYATLPVAVGFQASAMASQGMLSAHDFDGWVGELVTAINGAEYRRHKEGRAK